MSGRSTKDLHTAPVFTGGIAPNQAIVRSDLEVHREMNIVNVMKVVTVVTCADTMTFR